MDLVLSVGYDTPTKHAQEQMRELGITYKLTVPQILGDCWWFFGCDNVDVDNLPEHIEIRDFGDLSRLVGYGLSKKNVIDLQGYYNEPIFKEVKQQSKSNTLYKLEDVKLFLELDGVKHELKGFNVDGLGENI